MDRTLRAVGSGLLAAGVSGWVWVLLGASTMGTGSAAALWVESRPDLGLPAGATVAMWSGVSFVAGAIVLASGLGRRGAGKTE